MGHNCGSTCKRKNGQSCDTCQTSGGIHPPMVIHRGYATPQEKGAAVDMYIDGLSYRKTAQNVETYFGRPTNATTVYRWVRELTEKANDVLGEHTIDTGPEWVADEHQISIGGEKYWVFNVMDSKTRYLLSAHISRERTTKAAATALAKARERAGTAPEEVKTDGLASYRQAVNVAFPRWQVKHVVSQGIRARINNNLSERLQGTFRDRDKTLRGLKKPDTGQEYIDGLVIHYNYFRPHQGLDGKAPAQAAGTETPFESWQDVAAMREK